MDKAGIAYRREENCFPWIADIGRAQELMEQQRGTDWPSVLVSGPSDHTAARRDQ